MIFWICVTVIILALIEADYQTTKNKLIQEYNMEKLKYEKNNDNITDNDSEHPIRYF